MTFSHSLYVSSLDIVLLSMHLYEPLKPGLHIVVTIAEHACDHVLERVLKLSTYRINISPEIFAIDKSIHFLKVLFKTYSKLNVW